MNRALKITFIFIIILTFGCKQHHSQPGKTPVKPSSGPGKPVIDVINDTVNFGTIEQGEQVLCYFKVAVKQGTWEIDEIKPGCGCTIVENQPKKYKAGDTAVIKATFDSWGYNGFQYKTIEIFNNSQDSVLELVIIGSVK